MLIVPVPCRMSMVGQSISRDGSPALLGTVAVCRALPEKKLLNRSVNEGELPPAGAGSFDDDPNNPPVEQPDNKTAAITRPLALPERTLQYLVRFIPSLARAPLL